jgi:hypothetical protein
MGSVEIERCGDMSDLQREKQIKGRQTEGDRDMET